MLMKVFQKGQVVIPAGIRHELGISLGDTLDVEIDREHQTVELRKPQVRLSKELAGALAHHVKSKKFPTRQQMRNALAEGLRNG